MFTLLLFTQIKTEPFKSSFYYVWKSYKGLWRDSVSSDSDRLNLHGVPLSAVKRLLQGHVHELSGREAGTAMARSNV